MAERFAADPTLAATSSYKLAQIRDQIDPPQQWLDRAIEPTGVPEVQSALGNFSSSASNVSAYLTDQVGQASGLLGALADGTGQVDQELASRIQSLGLLPGVPPPSGKQPVAEPTEEELKAFFDKTPDGQLEILTQDAGTPVEDGGRTPVQQFAEKVANEFPHSGEGPAEAFADIRDIDKLAVQSAKPIRIETPAVSTKAITGPPDNPGWAQTAAHPVPSDIGSAVAAGIEAGIGAPRMGQRIWRYFRDGPYWGREGPPDVDAENQAYIKYWNRAARGPVHQYIKLPTGEVYVVDIPAKSESDE